MIRKRNIQLLLQNRKSFAVVIGSCDLGSIDLVVQRKNIAKHMRSIVLIDIVDRWHIREWLRTCHQWAGKGHLNMKVMTFHKSVFNLPISQFSLQILKSVNSKLVCKSSSNLHKDRISRIFAVNL